MSQQSTIFPLKVSDLTVRKRGKTILSKINLTLNQSGFTVVMGPNGSGKTTLLRVMHGLERPRQGSVEWSVSTEDARSRQAFVLSDSGDDASFGSRQRGLSSDFEETVPCSGQTVCAPLGGDGRSGRQSESRC